jgi:hypothetical protein
MWWDRDIHFMAARKQRGVTGRGQGQGTAFRGIPPVTYFFHLGPTFLLPPPGILSKVWSHQWIKPLIKSESSWSNSLWKCPHGHIQRCALPVSHMSLNPVKLIIKINHHKWLECLCRPKLQLKSQNWPFLVCWTKPSLFWRHCYKH